MNRMTLFAAIGALAATAAAASVNNVISQKGKQFSLPELDIHQGDSVVYMNDDVVAHNVYVAFNDSIADTGLQAPGESASVTFHQTGEFAVRCAIHPNMKMTVRVGE